VAQVRLWQVGRLMPPKLAAHLEERGCLPVLYMSSWLLTVFASAFPLSFASRVMDVLLTDSYSEPMMKVGCHMFMPGKRVCVLRIKTLEVAYEHSLPICCRWQLLSVVPMWLVDCSGCSRDHAGVRGAAV
jgi:Rab-GTPase-TBC domain